MWFGRSLLLPLSNLSTVAPLGVLIGSVNQAMALLRAEVALLVNNSQQSRKTNN